MQSHSPARAAGRCENGRCGAALRTHYRRILGHYFSAVAEDPRPSFGTRKPFFFLFLGSGLELLNNQSEHRGATTRARLTLGQKSSLWVTVRVAAPGAGEPPLEFSQQRVLVLPIKRTTRPSPPARFAVVRAAAGRFRFRAPSCALAPVRRINRQRLPLIPTGLRATSMKRPETNAPGSPEAPRGVLPLAGRGTALKENGRMTHHHPLHLSIFPKRRNGDSFKDSREKTPA